jgi:hypothetical protein
LKQFIFIFHLGGMGSRGSTSQSAAMDIAITRLTFNEATNTNKLLREARLDAVAAAKKRGAGSLHGWLDALAMSSEANHAIKRGEYFKSEESVQSRIWKAL